MGDSPTGVKVRDLVAWVAFVEETKRMKPTDKAIVRMVSESPGRNVSEPVGGLENALAPEAEPAFAGRRQHESSQADRSDETFRRGVRDSTVTRAGQATGEAVLVPPRNRWSRVGHITGATGKVADGETVAEGFVVCAEQRVDREGSSPSGARMRSAISERGGNASRAGKRKQVWRSLNGHESESGTQAKADLEPPPAVLRRAGCPP